MVWFGKHRLARLKRHCEEVSGLLYGESSNSYEMATLIVGSEQKVLHCHKILLGYFSKFFEGALFGGFNESEKVGVNLPEETPKDMSIYLSWIYTGGFTAEDDLPSTTAFGALAVRMWALGDKLMTPKFSNTIMLHMIERLEDSYLLPEVAEKVYNDTLPGSGLRSFVRELISLQGPFSSSYPLDKESWVVMLAKGGDLVKDCVVVGFCNSSSKHYQMTSLYKSCLQALDETSPEEWLVSISKRKVSRKTHIKQAASQGT